MSNRTLVEINHDFCPQGTSLAQWGSQMRSYIMSGDPKVLPPGITFIVRRNSGDLYPEDTLDKANKL